MPSTRFILALPLVFVFLLSFSQISVGQTAYRFDLIATSNSNFLIFPAPSINNNGEVSFAGKKLPGGGAVLTDNLPNQPTDLLPALSGSSLWTASGQTQINDSRKIFSYWEVLAANGTQHHLFVIDGRQTNTFTNIASANLPPPSPTNNFDQIYALGLGFNNQDRPVFQTRLGSNSSIFSTGVRPDFVNRVNSNTFGQTLRPQISDTNTAVMRLGPATTSPIVIYDDLLNQASVPTTIAATAGGFSQIGQSPSISKNDEAVAFFADLDGPGATALGTNAGPGIFVSIKLPAGGRKIVRIAGRLVEDIFAKGGNNDGICDAGEACVQGELGTSQAGNRIFFNSFDPNSRIDVAYIPSGTPGLTNDLVMVSFIATPNIASDVPGNTFSNQTGLWTQIAEINDDNGTVNSPKVANPVAQIGDVISGHTLTGISVFDQIANNVERVAFYATSSTGNMIFRAVRDPGTPVIFIAGVGGSEFRDPGTDQRLWPPAGVTSNLTPLSINNPVKVPDVIRDFGTGVAFGYEIKDSIYTSFLNSLKSTGYVEYNVDGDESRRNSVCGGQDVNLLRTKHPTLFVFPYDWRKTNSHPNSDGSDGNTRKLRDYIQCVQTIYPDTQVNIVAHSMGGLLARRYILENAGGSHKVKSLVTIGTPWLGAPRGLHALETGSFIGAAFSDTISEGVASYLSNALFAGQIKQIIEGFPGGHQLLPSEPFFALGGMPLRVDGVDYGFTQTKDWINSRHPSTNPGNQMTDFHTTAQDDFRGDSSGVNYYHIYGKQKSNKTVGQIERRMKATYTQAGIVYLDEEIVPYSTVGDGTVPLISSSRRTDATDGLNLTCGTANDKRCIGVCYSDKVFDKDSDHNGMTKNPQVQSQVRQILRFTDGLIPNNPSFDTGDCVTQGLATSGVESHYLTLTGINQVTITDAQGRSNQSISTAYRLAVPGVLEQPIGPNSIQVITPIDNTYTIRFTSAGTHSAIEDVRGTTNQPADVAYLVRYDDVEIPNGAISEIKIINNLVDSLKYDSNGDGIPDTVITPTRVVTSPQAADLQPPTIAFNWFRPFNAYQVSVSLTDSFSGVKRMFYRYRYGAGAGPFYTLNQSTYVDWQLPISMTGIEVVSEDNAGNRSGLIYSPRP